ncbi:MAG: hypothetical protein SF187_19640 [Deltaproteobacteria bacterium]|nr:hypothetical protein [Deltaproteobacteria bacterium]
MPQAVLRGCVLVLWGFVACAPAGEPDVADSDDPDAGSAQGGADEPAQSGGSGGERALDAGALGGQGQAGKGGGGGDTKLDAALSTDASGGQPAAAGACKALFCEDFEAADTINTKVWTVRNDNGNSVTLDKGMVAHGQRSAKFHAAANSRLSMIFAKLTPLAVRQHLWGRAYFYVTPEPPEGHTAFVTAGTMDGYSNSDDHQEIAGYQNSWQLGFWGNGEIISAGGKIPLKRWACIEWEMNNEVGNMTVYVDGAKSHAGAGYGKNKIASGFTDVAFGFRSWHPANYVVDIWMDDIAISDQRVGCL